MRRDTNGCVDQRDMRQFYRAAAGPSSASAAAAITPPGAAVR